MVYLLQGLSETETFCNFGLLENVTCSFLLVNQTFNFFSILYTKDVGYQDQSTVKKQMAIKMRSRFYPKTKKKMFLLFILS